MKRSIFTREKRSPTSIALSIAIHVLVIAAIASITFSVPIAELLTGRDRPPRPATERLTFVRLTPQAQGGGGGVSEAPVAPPGTGERIRAPERVPVGVTPPPPADTGRMPGGQPTGLPGGTGTAPGRGSGDPRAIGVEPGLYDPRISAGADPVGRIPRTVGQMTDSVIDAAYRIYRDSVLAVKANPQRAPGDWTFDRNGEKYGWDAEGIHVGKFTIPNAVLAAINLPVTAGRNINAMSDGRMASWTRSDLQLHASAMSQDDFRAAVKRIRARKDREKQEQAIQAGKAKPPQD